MLGEKAQLNACKDIVAIVDKLMNTLELGPENAAANTSGGNSETMYSQHLLVVALQELGKNPRFNCLMPPSRVPISLTQFNIDEFFQALSFCASVPPSEVFFPTAAAAPFGRSMFSSPCSSILAPLRDSLQHGRCGEKEVCNERKFSTTSTLLDGS